MAGAGAPLLPSGLRASYSSCYHLDEPTYRVWRLFMAGSADGFRTRRLNVYQTLLAYPGGNGSSGLPFTRADWYRQ